LIPKAWLRLAASVVETYLRATSRSIKLQILSDDGTIHSRSDINAIATESSPMLFLFWNAHSLLFLSSYLSSPELTSVGTRFEAVADDSSGGLLSQILFSRIGLETRRLRFRSIEDRLDDLRSLLEAKPSLVMAADSHGPYRSISPGMARLARSYSDGVRPISLVCNRRIAIFPRIGMAVPLRGATILLNIGKSIGRCASVADTRMALQSSLIALESQSIALLVNQRN
jgi:lysophospholipid acyltransferase (LPLAT)-like uncharacterized protein